MKNSVIKIWLPLIVSISVAVGMFVGFVLKSKMPAANFFAVQQSSSLDEVTALIKTKYVDKVDIDAITDTAIIALLSKLDPHSNYIPPQKLNAVNDEIAGSFFGIGVEFLLLNDTINVTNVLQGGPAEKAGVTIGDKLLKAGDSSLILTSAEGEMVKDRLRGPNNSKLILTLLRGAKQKTVSVTRGPIPLPSLDAAYLIEGKTGYIRLNRFSTRTYTEFMTALTALNKQGMNALVLDLRDNGGGVLDEAVEIADEFLSGDKLITYTEGVHSPRKEYRCRREGQFEKGKLVVLANENSASASEILMGALQDWDRATIIGHTSFGKGLVQDQFNLSNKGALRLTVARYFTPVGRSIQRSYANGRSAYFHDAFERFGATTDEAFDTTTAKKYKTMGGKTIYAGGGIRPDYFIKPDTTILTKATATLLSKGLLSDYGYKFYMQAKDSLAKYKTAGVFAKSFSMDAYDWKAFEGMARKDSVDIATLAPHEKEYISDALKLSLARQLFKTEGFYETLNAKDPMVQKAIEILQGKL